MAGGDLLVLLHGAVDRTATLTAELRMWRHESRSRRAFEVATTTAVVGGMVHHMRGLGVEEPEAETVWRVVQGPSGRYRWDEISTTGSGPGVAPRGTQGCDGERAWFFAPDAVYLSRPHGCALTTRLLDPSWVLSHDLEIVGEASSGGRAVMQVRAIARPSRLRGGGAQDMAAERDLMVDVERGFLHSDTALVEGQPYDIMELRDVVVDPEVDAAVFDPDIPPGLKVFDHSQDQPEHRPWDRRRHWHFQWPISRW